MSVGTDVSLIISICAFTLLIIVIVSLFVIRFSHPDDNTGIAPKIIAIIIFSFAFISFLPLPISNAAVSDAISLSPEMAFYIITITAVVLLLFVVPFSLLFFKSIFVETGISSFKKRIGHAFIGALLSLIIFLVVTIPLFKLGNSGDLNFVEMSIASVAFVGWFPFSVLLGIGFVALPASLISTWYYRPNPIELEEFDRKSLELGERAKKMRELGEKLKKSQGGSLLSRRNQRNTFVESVAQIKQDYLHLQTAYHYKGGNPIWPWFNLIIGILSIIFNLMWVVQMVLCVFYKSLNVDPFGKLLEIMSFEGFFVISFTLFLFMAFFLLASTSYGLLHVSSYAPMLLAGYKLEARNTYSDSFLVNAALLLLMSSPAMHFIATTIPTYSKDGYIGLYYSKVNDCALFKSFYPNDVFFFVVMGFYLLAAILYFAWPPRKGVAMQAALEKMTKLKD